MPNGIHSFKFKGETFGMETIFYADEARAEKYNAFGQEKTFLGKLVKLGFIVQGRYVFHPDHWIPLEKTDNWHTHKRQSPSGKTILGRPKVLARKRR